MADRQPTGSTKLAFVSHDVSGLLSVAHLFPKSKGRAGIYVLSFANGESYVGHSVDVVTRWQDHRRKWGDIVATDFAKVSRTDLDSVERAVIRAKQAAGVPLRNRSYALPAHTVESDLDLVIERSDQFTWLNGGNPEIPDVEERVDNEPQRLAKRANYEKLSAHPAYGLVLDIVADYVNLTIPCPRATELTFWALSAMPSTNRSTYPRLAALSINTMETLVIGHEKDDPTMLNCFMNVSKSGLEESASVAAFLERNPDVYTDGVGHYATSGGDAITVTFDSLNGIAHAFSDDGFIHAARTLNLRLMKKGPTVQAHGHCLDLADDVFGVGPLLGYPLPEPDQVVVTDARSVSKNLLAVLDRFEDGFEGPLVVGQDRTPRAVLIPFGQWLEYLELAEEAMGMAENRVSDAVRSRITDEKLDLSETEDAFIARLGARGSQAEQ